MERCRHRVWSYSYRFSGDQVEWNTGNASTGVYFCHMSTNRFTTTKKMLLIR
ncbi:MAG: hypothetical protein AAB393_12980 [Bacteroidota bacterium]